MEVKTVIFDDNRVIGWETAESSQAGIVLAFDNDVLLGSVQYNLGSGYSLNVSVGGLEYFKGHTSEDSLKDIYLRIKNNYPNVVFKFYPVNEHLSDSDL